MTKKERIAEFNDKALEIISSQKKYKEYTAEANNIIDLDPNPSSKLGKRLRHLLLLIEDYESKNIIKEPIDPIDMILFRMEQQGLKQKDLVPFIGSRSRVSEVINRKRRLTITMIRKLSEGLEIPIYLLIG